MLARFFRICLGCSLISGLFAQPAAPVYGLIAGTVLDGSAKTPLRKANVTLTMMGAKPLDALAWTDDSGHFAFGYLPPGRYQLQAQYQGYQADSRSRRDEPVDLKAGETRSDFVIRLFRLASISGTVLGDDGEPAEGAMVMAVRPGQIRSRNPYGPRAVADSHGHYRISNLYSGKYIVLLQRSFNTSIHESAEVSAASPPPQQYVSLPQYYPGTDKPASATVLAIQPGKEISGIDFRAISRLAATIRGHVVPPPGISGTLSNAQIMLAEPGNRWGYVGSGAGPPDFAFVLQNVPPGQHNLVASGIIEGKQFRGVQRIDVSDTTPEINIALEPGVTLSGTVKVTGPDAASHPASYVALVPGDDLPWNGPPLRAIVNPDGTYQIPNVPQGVWDIDAGPVPKGGYLKSMRLGDQDVLAEDMQITSSTAALLKIVIATNGATIEGHVTNASGDSVQATVILMPTGRFEHVLSFRRQVFSDEVGHYEISGVMPGTYKLYALEDFDADNDDLKSLEKSAIAVELKEGLKTSQDLHVIVPPPEPGN